MPIENIYSNSPSITTWCKDGNDTRIHIDDSVIANIFAEKEIKTDSIEVEIDKKINKIKEEYENKLQRQKVHISRRNGVKGSRIHGRRCKATISKRSFRNKKSIVGFPNGS